MLYTILLMSIFSFVFSIHSMRRDEVVSIRRKYQALLEGLEIHALSTRSNSWLNDEALIKTELYDQLSHEQHPEAKNYALEVAISLYGINSSHAQIGAKIALMLKADPNMLHQQCRLLRCIPCSDIGFIRYILAEGANPNLPTFERHGMRKAEVRECLPLGCAKTASKVLALLEYGADPLLAYQSPFAAILNLDPEEKDGRLDSDYLRNVIHKLDELKIDPKLIGYSDENALHLLARKLDRLADESDFVQFYVRFLLDRGLEIDLKNLYETTPTQIARQHAIFAEYMRSESLKHTAALFIKMLENAKNNPKGAD